MAVDIKGLYGKYADTNSNQKVIRPGKNSKVKSERVMEGKRGDSLVETVPNYKDTIEISEQGMTALKEKMAVEDTKSNLSFDTVEDLSKYLYENFNIVKQGMAEISSKYLRDCLTDPDKRQYLFENLKAADEALEEKQGEVGFQSMKIKIDDDGEVTTESTSKSVAVNEQKRRRQIAAAVPNMPIVLYNIPARTGNKIDPKTVGKLAAVDNIVGAKDSSGNFSNILGYIDEGKKADPDFAVLSGNDQLILWTLQAGGTGGISGCANAYPHNMAMIYNQFMAGHWEEAYNFFDQYKGGVSHMTLHLLLCRI